MHPPIETGKIYLRVNRRDIAFLKFIFESYEGVASVTTLDAGQGRVVICVAPGCESEVAAILDDLAREIYFESEGEERPRTITIVENLT